MSYIVEQNIEWLKSHTSKELISILDYWTTKMKDNTNGGFYGEINGKDQLISEAEKGGVLNARILWTYSAAYNLTKDNSYLQMAEYAWDYIQKYFIDAQYGGVYWSVDYNGQPLKTRKQIYGQAFMIYALSEFYIATANENALSLAKDLFELIEKYSFDAEFGGYFEAFTQEWVLETDLRLSDKDENEKKTMNTHLHIIEGYAALYRVWKDEKLKKQIIHLLENFEQHIYDASSKHLILFFNEKWENHHDIISYGHDIEAGWLLQEAAEIVEEEEWVAKTKKIALALTDAIAEAIDVDGGLWYEKDGEKWVYQKHWWPQAESVVGFFNVYQISNDVKYLDSAKASWSFIENKIIDYKNGEWIWGVDQDGFAMQEEDKAGFWKCPYHNGRACMEIIRRTK
ncbi:AGE family epimerase/isomerase [Rhizosphaericola mali]|uniref:Cellobiose 2-epimerase n=1 Tax=Rhizosphaericola mali TaxID=2545455 RepID=A0A5P2G578_9BACT|nr:AGE family epimerase/isomerase [Rhizosphaericola mali]QES89838.1 N-acyl-D-glucosamine 2-epimerase [Rhizosphaericola mali]